MGFLAAIPTAVGIADAGASAGGFSSALGLLGAGVSAIGSIAAGNQAAAQAKYEAQVSRNNEVIAQQNANYATAAGETKSYEQGLKERAEAGAVTAGLAAGGIDVGSGSAADVRSSQAAIGQTNVEQVRQTAALQAYGYRTQATNFGAQANLDTAEAGFDAESGFIKGAGALITGASKFGGGGLFGNTDTSSGGTGGLY